MKYRRSNQNPVPREKMDRITRKAQQIIAGNMSLSDPNGSYTGVPADPREVPVQDADDL